MPVFLCAELGCGCGPEYKEVVGLINKGLLQRWGDMGLSFENFRLLITQGVKVVS